MNSKITIHYAPEYSGHVFAQSSNSDVLMDTVVVNTMGLVCLLELQAGKHCESGDTNECTAHYYKAANDFFSNHTSNVLAPSFKLSPLATVYSMLSWRDELTMSQWDFKSDGASERLSTLVEIEQEFKKSYGTSVDLPARIMSVMDLIKRGLTDCSSINLIIPAHKDLLRPIEAELIKCMEDNGTTVSLESCPADSDSNLGKIRKLLMSGTSVSDDKISLCADDKSFQIYIFDDEVACNEYMSHNAFKDVDVWIDGNNIEMDNWLSLMGKPVTGSSSENRLPLQSQMFMMGVNLLSPDLRLENLVAWLTLPKHPLDKFFRNILAQTIASKRGLCNKDCNDIIKKYIDGGYVYLTDEEKKLTDGEKQKIREKDKATREEKVNTFLPPYTIGSHSGIRDQKKFFESLIAWCNTEAHMMEEDVDNRPFCEQLFDVSSKSSAILSLLDTINKGSVNFETLSSWADTINSYSSSSCYTAQQGCRIVVTSPEKMVTPAHKTIWMGMEGNSVVPLDCNFLYPSERRFLENHAKIWDDDKATKYHKLRNMRAFTCTSEQLTVVVCKRRLGAEPEKHPIMVFLESKISNLDVVKSFPKLEGKLSKVTKIKESTPLLEIKITNADQLKWPKHLTPTIISTLVEHPFDYVMQYLLHIEADSRVEMGDVTTMNGNVAHAVIAELFAPREGQDYATDAEISVRCSDDNISSVLNNVIEQNGALLLQPENKLERMNFEEELKKCIKRLLSIIAENHLKVVACEKHKESHIGFNLPVETPEKADLTGKIDMILKDENNKLIVFDFKWSSSKTYHRGLLEANRSSQLELYKYMLNNDIDSPGNQCDRVAYFVMPYGRLYSHDHFEGYYCEKVDYINKDKNIVEQLKNSVNYRIKQIHSGVIESVAESNVADLQYDKDTESQNLFPLKTVENEDGSKHKVANKFSNYGLFNN